MAAVVPIQSMNNFILKPSPSIPNPLHNEITPLTVFDRAAGDFHYPVLLAFRSTMPSNSVLTEGLSRVLAPYPHLAGRITHDTRSRPCFVLNNAGVRLVETKISAPLSEKSLIENPTAIGSLYPPVRDGVEEMFQVQLNRYACGGMVIGFTYSHTVADGMSMCGFLTQWAEAVRGVTHSPLPPPYVDRNSLFVPRNPPVCKYDHAETESKDSIISLASSTGSGSGSSPVENVAIQFPAEFISELKRRVPYRCTTFECLLAHLWRKIVEARGHPDEERTRVRIAVNGRGRMRPKVPLDYFGNLVCWALPTSQVGEVVRQGLGDTVGTIRKSIKHLNDDYFRSFIDFGETLDREGGNEELMVSVEEWGDLIYPDLEVDSWLGFPVDDIDFGSGGPRAILSPDIPVEGIITFVPSLGDGEKGGVDVYMTLRSHHVDKFRSICYSLD